MTEALSAARVRERPKSAILMFHWSPRRRFRLLRSRWMIRLLWGGGGHEKEMVRGMGGGGWEVPVEVFHPARDFGGQFHHPLHLSKTGRIMIVCDAKGSRGGIRGQDGGHLQFPTVHVEH
jgi:hypothetical protein